MTRPMARRIPTLPALLGCAVAALATLGAADSLRAQQPASAPGVLEAPVRWVDGRPMVRVTLRAGEKVYYCHLLVDLATSLELYLHRNAGGALRSEEADVEFGDITLRAVPFRAKRDTWLEGLTAQYADELQQVPVAGILGIGAFGKKDVELDGPGSRLRLLPPTSAGGPVPPDSEAITSVAFGADRERGWRVPVDFGNGARGMLGLHTREPFSWIDPSLAAKAGHPDGVVSRAVVTPFLDLGKWTPFRPMGSEAGDDGGIGGRVLQQMVLTVQPVAARVLFAMPAAPQYPELDAAFQRAFFGTEDPEPLRRFLADHPDAPQAAEAAAALLERLHEQGGAPEATLEASLAAIRAAPVKAKATTAVKILADLDRDPLLAATRKGIAEAGLAVAREDEDGNAAHKLRLELGRLARESGDLKEARRHLLAAVFGMPVDGNANLEMGSWHEDQGQWEQAAGRHFLALLDMKNTGEAGFVAFERAFRVLNPDGDLLAALEDRADGRVPSFQPIPRDPATVRKTGRTTLVELFTGAMCPPCAAADLAADALDQYHDEDELVLVQWHLPVPAPEPMVSPAALQRADALSIQSTPTLVLDGSELIEGGGKAEEAGDLFRKYVAAVEPRLARPQLARVEAGAVLEGKSVKARVSVQPTGDSKATQHVVRVVLTEDLLAFPGKNGILFHHHVARASFTPSSGAKLAVGATFEGSVDLGQLEASLDDLVLTYEQRGPFAVRPVRPDPKRLRVVVVVEDGSGSVIQCAAVRVEGAGK